MAIKTRSSVFVALGCILLTFLCVSSFLHRHNSPMNSVGVIPSLPPLLPEKPKLHLKEIIGTFTKNQTITDILKGHGLSSEQVDEIVKATRPVYNLAMVRISRPYWLYLTPEGAFHDFRYPVDDEKYLTVYKDGNGRVVPVMKEFAYQTRVEPVFGVISDSLFSTVLGIGEQERLALDFADIFGWDIDFYTDIQKGDSFRILVEKKYLNGSFVKYGSILAAEMVNVHRELKGFRFTDQDGKPAYYAQDGTALKKSFLKSPLKFGRISSRFSSARLHPVLKIVRPHLGVDYAAPLGTPVQAVGTGIVTAAGFSGANGNMVRIRHTGGYETMYLHLSRIAVRTGARIAQGEVVGYVGSTGLSTGPHLDFRILQHGNYVNPAKLIFPPNPPVRQGSMAQFAGLRDKLQVQLAQVGY